MAHVVLVILGLKAKLLEPVDGFVGISRWYLRVRRSMGDEQRLAPVFGKP
jgi:hypothetical protein